ncbi:hypothetical protein Tco_0864855 [Tanacetum coccineum]
MILLFLKEEQQVYCLLIMVTTDSELFVLVIIELVLARSDGYSWLLRLVLVTHMLLRVAFMFLLACSFITPDSLIHVSPGSVTLVSPGYVMIPSGRLNGRKEYMCLRQSSNGTGTTQHRFCDRWGVTKCHEEWRTAFCDGFCDRNLCHCLQVVTGLVTAFLVTHVDCLFGLPCPLLLLVLSDMGRLTPLDLG